MRNQSTAAQRRYIEALAAGAGDSFADYFNEAARINHNGPIAEHETPTQASRRLTKTAASALIDSMLAAGIGPKHVPDPYVKAKPQPFLNVREPEPLSPVETQAHDDLIH